MIREALVGAIITSLVILLSNSTQSKTIHEENAKVLTRIVMLIIFVMSGCALIGSYIK